MSVDGLVFSASRLGMDESSITGESNMMRKNDVWMPTGPDQQK